MEEEGYFSAKDNLRLFWQSITPEQPKAHLGIVHGYADHLGRFRKTVDFLVAQGFAVHAFDYRGHGRADGRRGYCGHFSEYVDDLERFWGRVRTAAGTKKSFLLGHSHGGLMSLHLLQRNPEALAGLVLSAPYLKLALEPPMVKVLAAKVASRLAPWAPFKTELTPRDLSRDPAEQALTDKDPLYFTTVTPRWFTESNRAQLEALKLGSKVTLPLFLFCGSEDGVASAPTSRAFFETVASKDKKFKEYPGMLHECLNEIGKEQVWKEIANWISSHL